MSVYCYARLKNLRAASGARARAGRIDVCADDVCIMRPARDAADASSPRNSQCSGAPSGQGRGIGIMRGTKDHRHPRRGAGR